LYNQNDTRLLLWLKTLCAPAGDCHRNTCGHYQRTRHLYNSPRTMHGLPDSTLEECNVVGARTCQLGSNFAHHRFNHVAARSRQVIVLVRVNYDHGQK
jgi:hypothetical protein